ncbi:hypothetical protein K450DRAFT_262133 [Umbelopsis ramanniana AG]|uniref:Uncharacterized protein n=1 Tax=Umbelopsis ramanniana AG TaxID=1314678 RepID=A0AAD5E0K5_UMBRA|nr:uncharacterized protein K450DRAFT_262133 [Umbelopsis ramanniana AG]KAI8575376.1 hypothetical protein K450DRAFT_262133 [Umbelopsis ramanniana AG]
MQLQCVTMTAPIEEELTATEEKSLKVNTRHSPARPSSLPDDATLTPQSLSPHNSTIGPSHASFSDHGDLQNSQSGHVVALRSPRMEPTGSQGWENRSPTSAKHEEGPTTKHELDASDQDRTEPSKKRRLDGTDDIEHTEAYEELRRGAFQALQSIEQDFAKLRERLYHERLAEIEKEVVAISTGKHPTYAQAMSEIDSRRKKQMEQVSEWRRHKNTDIHRQVQSSLRSAHVTFLAKRAELRRSVMDSIMNQKQKLTDEMMLFNSTGKLEESSK